MDGKQQTIYPRKNWSSVVLWNCGHESNKKINRELVNNPDTTGKYLHRFSWLEDHEIVLYHIIGIGWQDGMRSQKMGHQKQYIIPKEDRGLKIIVFAVSPTLEGHVI